MQLVVGEGEPWLQAPAEAQVFNLLLQKLSLLGLHHFLSIFRQVFCELRAARCDGFFRSISKAIGIPLSIQLMLCLAADASTSPEWGAEALRHLKESVPAIKERIQQVDPSLLQKVLVCFKARGEGADFRDLREQCTALDLTDERYRVLRPIMVEEGGKGPGADPLRASLAASTASLSAVMQENGYSCAKSAETFREILGIFGNVDAGEVAKVVAMMARTHTGLPDTSGLMPGLSMLLKEPLLKDGEVPPAGWNSDIVIDTIKEQYPAINWGQVAAQFDHPEFLLPDFRAFQLLVGMHCYATREAFPLGTVYNTLWGNTAGQVSFLAQSVSAAVDGFSLEASPRRVPSAEELVNGSQIDPFHTLCWSSVDLLESLMALGDSGESQKVLALLEYPMKHCPQLLAVGMSCFFAPWSATQEAVLGALMPTYLSGHPSSRFVLHRTWQANPEMVVRYLGEWFARDPAALGKIIDICQDLKGLALALSLSTFPFMLELAAAAAGRDLLNLEKWLKDMLASKGLLFAYACVQHLGGRGADQPPGGGGADAVFFQVLEASARMFPPELAAEFEQIKSRPGAADPTSGPFSPEIEAEANQCLSQLYQGKVGLEALIVSLETFKNGGNPREQAVYGCLVHNLFDEYRFIQQYPEREMLLTAALIGQLVQTGLLSGHNQTGLALRCILDALSNAPDAKVFAFGLKAVEQFKGRLGEWPQFTNQLLLFPHLRQAAPELVQALEKAPAPAAEAGGDGGFAEDKPPEPEAFAAPDEGVADQIHFIVNNLSPQNLEAKCKDIRKILKAEWFAWFSNYLVTKRAAQEANFHHLYIALLKAIGAKTLWQTVIRTTIRNTKAVLHTDRVKTSSTDRSLFKNLGLWLGQLTIARCKPVLAKDLCLKQMILDAYKSGKMIAAIPFVHNVIKPAKGNKIFSPPNPWTVALLSLIVEIYNLDKLKLNLKFEVEMLFKNMDMKIKDVRPSSILTGIERTKESNPDFAQDKDAEKDKPAPRPMGMENTALPLPGMPRMGQSPDDPPSDSIPAAAVAQSSGGINLAAYIVINPNLSVVAERLQLKRVIPTAVDQAIREIIAPVVERSVTIACKTTMELTLKDFAMEPDEQRLRLAAHLMVKSLAGSLALVTCKEPLRAQLLNHLRQLLQAQISDSNVLEQTLNLITSDNLDLCCSLIEKTSTDKAQRSIDELLVNAYAARRKHWETMPQQPFIDVNVLTSGRFPPSLPEVLRPKPGHLNPSQFRVYEDFSRMIRAPPSGAADAAAAAQAAATAAPGVGLDARYAESERGRGDGARDAGRQPAGADEGTAAPRRRSPPVQQTREVVARMQDLLRSLEAACAEDPQAAFDALAPAHPVRQLAKEVEGLVLSAGAPLGLPGQRQLAEVACRQLYQGGSGKLRIGALVQALAGVRYAAPGAVAELPSWILALEDNRWLDRDIAEALARARLLPLAHIDAPLAKLVLASTGQRRAMHGNGPVELAIHVVRQCVVIQPLASAQDLAQTLDVLSKIAAQGRGGGAGDALAQLVEQARLVTGAPAQSPPGGLSPPAGEGADGEPRLDGALGLGGLGKGMASAELPPVAGLGGKAKVVLPFGQAGPGKAYEPGQGLPIARLGLGASSPPGMQEQIAQMLQEWVRVCELPADSKAINDHLGRLHQSGLVKSEDIALWFFRILVELSAGHCVASEAPSVASQPSALSFAAVDACVKLIVLLLQTTTAAANKADPAERAKEKAFHLGKVLGVVAGSMLQEAQERAANFNPRPYFRMFVGLYAEVLEPEVEAHGPDGAFPLLLVVADALYALQAAALPEFAFAWLELACHKAFMPHVLLASKQRGWFPFQRLLVALLRFLEPYLRHAEMVEPVRLLYKGTLRMLLVLLHDFPEFLCDHHFDLCDAIPPSCIQMRNLILSAFPRDMRLPDPFTPNLKVDLLPEISEPPRIVVNFASRLGPVQKDLDAYLASAPQPQSPFISELCKLVLLPAGDVAIAGTKYDVKKLNALVLYVGMQAIQQLQAKSQMGENASIAQSASMLLFQQMVTEFEAEGRFLFLNAIANQLRYPNNHTHYFSCVLLYVFAESSSEAVKEQITRVLLERLIVNRPHPWGLLISFIELIKNPRYSFWSHPFTRCAPEIERLFDNVARSCIGHGFRKDQVEAEAVGA